MVSTAAGLSGLFVLTHVGPDGSWQWDADIPNGVTLAGCDYLNGVAFSGVTASADWRLGLISDAGFSAVSPADTHGSHGGWVEYAAGLSRTAWPSGTPASGVLYNPSPARVTVGPAGTIRGVFVANRTPVGSLDPAGALYATAAAAAGLPVLAGGILFITYGVTAKDNGP
jgi:hypothetical protein